MREKYINIPKINEKETKKALERELFKYRDYLITLPIYLMPKVTASYSLTPPSSTNEFHSKTEDSALERVEFIQKRDEFMSYVQEAVNTLKEQERQIIIQKYFDQDVIGYDVEIWTDLGIGKTKYYKLKWEAMLRLAFALKLEVYLKSGVKAG